jgi:class 3 adenylate cyclase
MRLRGIGMRLVALTGLLVLATVAVVVWQWAATQAHTLRTEKSEDAMSTAVTMAAVFMDEIDDANWSQVRVDLEMLMKNEPDFVYAAIHGARVGDQILAGAPHELNEQFVPDLVPASVTADALSAPGPRNVQVPVLRDVTFLGEHRASKGETVTEVSAPILTAAHERIGTLRVGLSLAAIARAERVAIHRALTIGALALVGALVGALWLARRLSRPIERLAADAARIAAGQLQHRARVDRNDEIGELATAFNDMSRDLELSFGKLQGTLDSFERFVPRKFLSVVAPDGIEKIVVGTASPRRISVLFSDLRGFTKLSEKLTPLEVFHLLNEYLARMGRAIDSAGGFVDKYIGDAIMALFDDDHTDGVVRAIQAMTRELRELNAVRAARGEPPIAAGIGAHGGDVVMGTIGFASKIESTVIGDAVNVASRVEAMTKDRGVSVLITGEIIERLADRGAFELVSVQTGVAVRGRLDPIDLWTLETDAVAATQAHATDHELQPGRSPSEI